jgi:4'-phosphopantetheinyl transferase
MSLSSMPRLLPGRCQVWWARPADAHPAHLALLSDVERDRHEKLVRPADRARFLAAATLLRLVVGAHQGLPPAAVRLDRRCADCDRQHGKPRPLGTDLAVSVSHSDDRVAVACGLFAEVGVDVEGARALSDLDSLSERVLHPTERLRLPSGDPDRRREAFLTYWTRKEAVVKTTGDGLRAELSEVTVSGPEEAPRLVAYPGRPELPERFSMAQLAPGDGHLAAVAVLRAPGEPAPGEGWVSEHDGSVPLARAAH